MNPREKLMAMILLAGISLGGIGFLGYQFLLAPLRERDATIALLREENERKRDRINQVLAEKPKLEWYRRLSLPADPDLARRDYEKFLTEQLRLSGFSPTSFSVTPRPIDAKSSPAIPGKGPIYTKLVFNVVAHGGLNGFVDFLQRFYRTGLLHQIRNLSLQRPVTVGPQQRPRELDINLTIEALIVTGAENRADLLPGLDPRIAAFDLSATLRGGPANILTAAWSAVGPNGPRGRLALADPPRNYSALGAKDIFFGPPATPSAPVVERTGNEVDVTRFVFLTDITRNDRRTEAFLYDRYNNRRTRLRDSAGFDSFRFLDEQGDLLVRGQVIRIEPRDVIVRVDGQYYAIHVGQSLDEALRQPLSRQLQEEMKLPPLSPPAATDVSDDEDG